MLLNYQEDNKHLGKVLLWQVISILKSRFKDRFAAKNEIMRFAYWEIAFGWEIFLVRIWKLFIEIESLLFFFYLLSVAKFLKNQSIKKEQIFISMKICSFVLSLSRRRSLHKRSAWSHFSQRSGLKKKMPSSNSLAWNCTQSLCFRSFLNKARLMF